MLRRSFIRRSIYVHTSPHFRNLENSFDAAKEHIGQLISILERLRSPANGRHGDETDTNKCLAAENSALETEGVTLTLVVRVARLQHNP